MEWDCSQVANEDATITIACVIIDVLSCTRQVGLRLIHMGKVIYKFYTVQRVNLLIMTYSQLPIQTHLTTFRRHYLQDVISPVTALILFVLDININRWTQLKTSITSKLISHIDRKFCLINSAFTRWCNVLMFYEINRVLLFIISWKSSLLIVF